MIKHVLFAFIIVLEGMIIADLLFSFLSKKPSDKLKAETYHQITEPLFRPIRFIIKHSSFNNLYKDVSPYVTLTILIYVQKLLLM